MPFSNTAPLLVHRLWLSRYPESGESDFKSKPRSLDSRPVAQVYKFLAADTPMGWPFFRNFSVK